MLAKETGLYHDNIWKYIYLKSIQALKSGMACMAPKVKAMEKA